MSLVVGSSFRQILFINMYVSFYLGLSKYIDLDHLCHNYLASITSLES